MYHIAISSTTSKSTSPAPSANASTTAPRLVPMTNGTPPTMKNAPNSLLPLLMKNIARRQIAMPRSMKYSVGMSYHIITGFKE